MNQKKSYVCYNTCYFCNCPNKLILFAALILYINRENTGNTAKDTIDQTINFANCVFETILPKITSKKSGIPGLKKFHQNDIKRRMVAAMLAKVTHYTSMYYGDKSKIEKKVDDEENDKKEKVDESQEMQDDDLDMGNEDGDDYHNSDSEYNESDDVSDDEDDD